MSPCGQEGSARSESRPSTLLSGTFRTRSTRDTRRTGTPRLRRPSSSTGESGFMLTSGKGTHSPSIPDGQGLSLVTTGRPRRPTSWPITRSSDELSKGAPVTPTEGLAVSGGSEQHREQDRGQHDAIDHERLERAPLEVVHQEPHREQAGDERGEQRHRERPATARRQSRL